jgi:WD40 repeat protein
MKGAVSGLIGLGHQAPVNSASFSPDGQQVVTASDDGTARLWDIGNRATSTKVLEGHQDSGQQRQL